MRTIFFEASFSLSLQEIYCNRPRFFLGLKIGMVFSWRPAKIIFDTPPGFFISSQGAVCKTCVLKFVGSILFVSWKFIVAGPF